MDIDERSKLVITLGTSALEGVGRCDGRRDGIRSLLRALPAKGRLGQDKIDFQSTAKEVSRFTTKPEERDMTSG